MGRRCIYKYTLENVDTQTLTLPAGSEILSVINQHENVCLYACVDPMTAEIERYSIQIYGTGHNIRHDDTYRFLGTVAMFDGDFILHVFYKKL